MESIKTILSRAVIRMLNPIVRLLLRYEVSHSEFTELSRKSYVDVAFKHYSLPDRKPSNSRVSVITGLSRKEVVRLKDLEVDEPPKTKGPINRATRVIGGWLSNEKFLDEEGEPRILPLRGEENSFDDLAAQYSGGITSRAILDELIRVGAVEKIGKDAVKLNHLGYVPQNNEEEMIELLSAHMADLLSTLLYNLTRRDKPARFQREVVYKDVPLSLLEEFQKLNHDKSMALLRELNQWLSENIKERKAQNRNEPCVRAGVGIYFFKNEKWGDHSNENNNGRENS